MLRITLSLILSIFLISYIHADGENTYGIVRDKETLMPLAGVKVTVVGSGDTQITDSTGTFSIKGAGILSEHGSLPAGSTIRWKTNTNILDISNAPDLTSLNIYNLDGRLLLHHRFSGEREKIELPPFLHNVHLLKVTTRHGNYISKIVPISENRVYTIKLDKNRPSRFIAKSAVPDTLLFEKDLYRSKKLPVNHDSIHNGFTVDLSHSIGDYLFLDTVRTYRLTITESEINTLLDYQTLSPRPGVTNTVYVPARLKFENRDMDSVAVRFRGDQSLWDCILNGTRKTNVNYPQYGFGTDDVCAKFSLKFNFKKYKNDQRLYGVKKINFRSMSFDPSKMRERLGYSFFNDMDIVAPRTAYARLYVNDEFWGLFCIVEEIDGRMTKHRFKESGDGNLYKDLWPDALTTDQMITDALRTNEEEGEVDDFKAFRDAVIASSTTEENFLTTVGKHVDIPYLIKYMVVDRAILNFDGVVSLYVLEEYNYRVRHNFSWYRDLPSTKFILIPWDLDKVFLYPEPNFRTNNQLSDMNPVPNWNVVNSDYTSIGCYFDPGSIALTQGSGPYYNVLPIDGDTFLRNFRNVTWDDFVSAGKQFLDEVFLQDTIDARLTHWRQQIAPSVGEDNTIDSTTWATMVDSLSHTVPLMRTHFKSMLDSLITNTSGRN